MKWEELPKDGISSLEVGKVLNEGKTKKIRPLSVIDLGVNTVEILEDVVGMQFKDDITAGDGAKHDTMKDKGIVDWKTNSNIFRYLNRCGIRTHFVEDFSSGISIVKCLDRKINLEVVVRRVATGSILKHTALSEGDCFRLLFNQFFYKDDSLHDPLIDRSFITHLIADKYCFIYNQMASEACTTFINLERAFAHFKLQLIDLKVEYGIVDGELTLIDEITAGSFRLWPYAGDSINLNQNNVLDQLNPGGRLDKDVYRQGGSLDVVNEKFLQVLNVTEEFEKLGFE